MGTILKTKKYFDELENAMKFLSLNKNVIFLGQSIVYSGNAIYNTTKKISPKKKIELPVFEDVQMGLSIGLAMSGFIPITCYPRFDFLICSMNQLVNHLDKIRRMSENTFKPRVIIRTSIGPTKPLNAGLQHTQDFTKIFKNVLKEINVVHLARTSQIVPEYKKALTRKDSNSTLLIEDGSKYNV